MADRAAERRRIGAIVRDWEADPELPVEYCEEVDGRWAVRVSQQSRDATTVWLDVGERTVSLEAYVLPAPPHGIEEVYRQLLFRNGSARLSRFAIDRDGEIYVRARVPLEWADADGLGAVFAEITEQIDLAFRPLLRAGFAPPPEPGDGDHEPREKSG